jgi:PKD repeat protein
LTNVMAVSPGRNASLPWCVVGAHYDTINGTDWSHNPYAPAPGADDDASGVAALLGMAEAFARAPTNRTIVFVAFTGEELGRIGSREFVRQLAENGTKIAGAVCLDMIGYNDFPKVDIVTDAASGWLAGMAMTAAGHSGLMPETVVSGIASPRWSDQVSFWEAGYPAIYFIEDENPTQDSAHFKANPYYHTGADTPGKLNVPLMTSIARAGAATVAMLAGLALPDLAPVLAPRPHTALAGEPAVFNVSLRNRADAVAWANVSFFVDGALWDTRTLVAGQNQHAYLSWIPGAGAHTVTIVANADARYVEWDRSDNTLVFDLDVAARPDIRILDVWASDIEPLPGEPLYIYAWMGNSGGAAALGMLVITSDQGAVILETDVALAAGAERAIVAATVAPTEPVNYSACITAVQPWESETGNNQGTVGIVPHGLDAGGISLNVVPEAGPALGLVRFEVQGASPMDGLEYLFDFGDGAGAGWTVSPSVVHMYQAEGTYNATVTARDSRGALAALAPVPVLVVGQHPVPVIETDGAAIHAGLPAHFSSARSYDPDGEIAGQSWEFGDGGVALGVGASHVFATPRPYTVRLTVVDGAGYYNLSTLQVVAIDDPPTPVISAGSRILYTGEQVGLDGRASFDRDGTVVAYKWSYDNGDIGTGPFTNFSFQSPGRYVVNLTVTDEFGVSGSAATEISVYARPAVRQPAPAGTGPSFAIIAAATAIVLVLVAIYAVMKMRGKGRRAWEEEE